MAEQHWCRLRRLETMATAQLQEQLNLFLPMVEPSMAIASTSILRTSGTVVDQMSLIWPVWTVVPILIVASIWLSAPIWWLVVSVISSWKFFPASKAKVVWKFTSPGPKQVLAMPLIIRLLPLAFTWWVARSNATFISMSMTLAGHWFIPSPRWSRRTWVRPLWNIFPLLSMILQTLQSIQFICVKSSIQAIAQVNEIFLALITSWFSSVINWLRLMMIKVAVTTVVMVKSLIFTLALAR